jgi:hypothetical protein
VDDAHTRPFGSGVMAVDILGTLWFATTKAFKVLEGATRFLSSVGSRSSSTRSPCRTLVLTI